MTQSIITRGMHILLGAIVFGYPARLLFEEKTFMIPSTELTGWFTLALLGCCALVYRYVGILGNMITRPRFNYFLLGRVLLIIADVLLIDNPEMLIFSADVIKLCAVVTIIGGVSKKIVPRDVEEKYEESTIEIIEV